MKTWSTRELLAYLDRVVPVLDDLDHFELLDVDADSDGAAIQAVFHTMAAALHPDRHRRELSTADRERLTLVYARIAEAYRVLRDPAEREAYLRDAARADAEVDANGSPEPDEDSQLALLSPKAQRLYRRAEAALRTGDRASALLNLRMALARHPQSVTLREALRRAESKG